MSSIWSRDALMLRIDRCYLVAAGTRLPEKRQTHLDRARHYRAMLATIADPARSGQFI